MSKLVEQDVLGAVIRLIESTLRVPADQVDIDANFESFGMNSLIVMELMENIEKEFEVTLTPAQFSNVDTVRGLTGLLERLLQEAGGAGGAPTASAPLAAPMAGAAAGRAAAPDARADSSAVIDHIRRKFAVDLSGRNFDSLDTIAGALVADHGAELLRHYGLAGQGGQHSHAAPVMAPEIAIVGISCRFPDAADHRVFWDNLLARKNSMREVPASRWDWQAHYQEQTAPGKTSSKWGALIDDVDCFDAGFFAIPSEEADALDPQLRLLLQESYRAVEDAGLDMKKLAGSRTGVFIGYEYSEYEHHLRRLNNKDFTKGPLFSSSSPSYYLSNRLSFMYDLRGPSESINVNCASSAVAINRAYYSLLNGESELAIAGAVSLNLFADDYIATSQYGVLSPDGTNGVFDDDANGFTRGEGVAAIVMKRLDDAERDGNTIYGIVRSCHHSYRGAARNISEVKHDAITCVLEECYAKAGVALDSVNYIEVDGYASKWADSFEYEGIKGAFANSALKEKHCALGSLKGNIGNTESVSGIANVIKLALSLHHKKFPATISKKKINTFIDIDNPAHPLYIADSEIAFDDIRKDSATPVRAGVNSFADSGANVHILLEEYMGAAGAAGAAPEAGQPKRLFVLSARDSSRLAGYVSAYIDFLRGPASPGAFADLVFTSQVGRQGLGERLAIVAASHEELLSKLEMVHKTGIREKLGMESKGIFYGRSNPADKNALAGLVTPDMAHMQLAQSLQSGEWKAAAMLWVHGVTLPWDALWQRSGARRISAPAYPFAKVRHWIDVALEGSAGQYVASGPAAAVATPAAPAAELAAVGAWHFYLPADPHAIVEGALLLSAAGKLELFMRQVIGAQQAIAADAVALDLDFIELGMDSVGVAELIIKLDALLGVNLSPSVLFKYPEIGALSEHLAEAWATVADALVVSSAAPPADAVRAPEPAAAQGAGPAASSAPQAADIVVPLRARGALAPIFALPGAGGGALSLQQLSHALGATQPFYCLEALGLDGRHPAMESIEEIAAFNIAAMKTVQPAGPYRLLGYSNGGVVAFEMTRQLLEGGEGASLILLDAASPLMARRDAVEEMADVFTHFTGSLGAAARVDPEALRQVPQDGRAGYLYAMLDGLGLGQNVPRDQFVATFQAAIASENACLAYQARALPVKIDTTLFKASDSYPGAPADYGWNALLGQPLRCHDIAASHFTLLDKDPAAELARKINLLGAKGSKKSAVKPELAVS